MIIHPVILCGGDGARLWPLSRKSYPKQFARLFGTHSLFQATVRRLSGPGFAAPIVVTSEAFRFIVTEQLAGIDMSPAEVLIEPDPRNTAPAALAAACRLALRDPGALMLMAPSDHVIPDDADFRAAVLAAAPMAEAGALVTFGIRPTRPETGYGYLALAEGADPRKAEPQPLARFVEKPDREAARAMLARGGHLWNAGILLACVNWLLEAYAEHADTLIDDVQEAVDAATRDLGLTRLAPEPWARLPDLSIDYALLEKMPDLMVMPYEGHWSDLGDWDAIWEEMEVDTSGTAIAGAALAVDCQDTLLRAESPGLALVGIGLTDIIAVAMSDAVLVAHRSEAQAVKAAVAAMKAAEIPQATAFARDHRPWGHFESLAKGDRFQVKRIVVQPGAALSLQSHHHRSEHWIVVQGKARVTIGAEVRLVTENQSIYIPLGERHRLENPGKLDMVLIEVQTGSYLGEDDILRYEDVYARN
jgi:mannose-1-phosphate guanylyltransferase / mannose-6-phosphate isomerase